MKIGIDFDNTIVCYDDVFYIAALEQGLIPQNINKDKSSVRDYLRSIGKEEEWIVLQGYIYGPGLTLATPFEGIQNFLNYAVKNKHDISIISHKTLHPYRGPKYNLQEFAKKWLKEKLDTNMIKIFFELTLQEKLSRIRDSKCDYFIDDLPELLFEENFPTFTKKVLFDPQNRYPKDDRYLKFSSWKDLSQFFCS